MRMVAGVLSVLAVAGVARAEETRFAVVDLAPAPENEKVVAAVEADVARLRPGARPLEDPVVRRLLATGEGPAAAAGRLLREAERRKASDDCTGAIATAHQAETVILNALSLDEERDQLKALYTLVVLCAAKEGKADERTVAATRLRALVSLPPSGFPQDLWDAHVAKAVPGPATTELLVDSDPPNAQVAVNFHGEGVTPRTLKVAPGQVFVEIQKEGFKKAFRALEVKEGRPARAVMRLIARTHDRVEQAEARLRVVTQGDLKEHVRTLSTLAQLARVETLVLFKANPEQGKVRIWFFDAERGALTETAIESAYDRQTGRVADLAARAAPKGTTPAAPSPAPAAAPTPPGPAPATPAAPPAAVPQAAPPGAAAPETPEAAPPAAGGPAPGEEGLPEAKAQQQQVTYRPRPQKQGPPWWSWAIAGAIAVAFGLFVFTDRTKEAETIGVDASWKPQ